MFVAVVLIVAVIHIDVIVIVVIFAAILYWPDRDGPYHTWPSLYLFRVSKTNLYQLFRKHSIKHNRSSDAISNRSKDHIETR